MAERTCGWTGDGTRRKEHYEDGPKKRPAGLTAATTGPRLTGVNLEIAAAQLRDWISAGRWNTAWLWVQVESFHADDETVNALRFELAHPSPQDRFNFPPSPIHLAIIEQRLRIHLTHGEWLVAAGVIRNEYEQAKDDAENGLPDDNVVRVHRTHPHNYGKTKARKD